MPVMKIALAAAGGEFRAAIEMVWVDVVLHGGIGRGLVAVFVSGAGAAPALSGWGLPHHISGLEPGERAEDLLQALAIGLCAAPVTDAGGGDRAISG